MFKKNTGNVFQNYGQCFGKLRAMFFRSFRKLLFVHLFVVPRGEIAQQTDKEQGERKIERKITHAVVLPIGVHSTEEIVDTEEGHQDGIECDHGKEVEQPKASSGLGHAEVCNDRIDNHRDECPGLFRIPSPIASPRLIRPDRP